MIKCERNTEDCAEPAVASVQFPWDEQPANKCAKHVGLAQQTMINLNRVDELKVLPLPLEQVAGVSKPIVETTATVVPPVSASSFPVVLPEPKPEPAPPDPWREVDLEIRRVELEHARVELEIAKRELAEPSVTRLHLWSVVMRQLALAAKDASVPAVLRAFFTGVLDALDEEPSPPAVLAGKEEPPQK